MLSLFSKIMYNHIISFMDTNNTTYKYQFGFRKNHSTQHVIITLVDKIHGMQLILYYNRGVLDLKSI